jgi:hypothetical protein
MSNDQAIVDLRAYTIRLRKTVEFLDVFDLLALPMPLKYPARPTGTFTSAVGSQVIHLGGFSDMGDFEMRHAERDKDQDWPLSPGLGTSDLNSEESAHPAGNAFV